MYTALLNQWRKHLKTFGESERGYAITEKCWNAVYQHISTYTIEGYCYTLETGSGLSTWLFETTGSIHTALEHSPHWYSITKSSTFIQKANLLLRQLENDPPWYVYYPYPPTYDLILIDGPPGVVGRLGILNPSPSDPASTIIESLISPGGVIVIDDVQREDEAHLGISIANRFNVNMKVKKSNTRQSFGVIQT